MELWFLWWIIQFPNDDGTRKSEGWRSWEHYTTPNLTWDECQTAWNIKVIDIHKQTKGIQYAGYAIMCKKQ